MTFPRLIAILSMVVMMSVGQILFKLAAGRLGTPNLSVETARQLVANPYFIAGIAIYAAATILWVVVLVDGELSRSYPFIALTMILVPLAGVLIFNEPISLSLVIGIGLVVAGLVVMSYF